MGSYKRFLVCLIIVSAFFVYNRCQAAEVNVCRTAQELPCDNSECILRERWCDGVIRHCADGTDEKYCKKSGWLFTVDNGCSEKHFVCGNGRCIPAVGQCDEFDDCGDYSDEDECGSPSPQNPEEDRGFGPVESASTRTYSHTTASTEATRPPVATPRDHSSSWHNGTGESFPISRSTTTTSTTTRGPTTRPTTSTTPTSPSGRNFYDRREQEPINPNQQSRPDTRRHDQSRNGRNNGRHQQTSSTQRRRDPALDPPAASRPDRNHASARNPYDSRQTQRVPLPSHRTVVRAPYPRQLHHSRKKAQKAILPAFYFANNYTEQFGRNYERVVKRAKEWLVDKRDNSYTWGQDTPRAMVALSLITNSFTSDVADNGLMKRGLQIHLAAKLLRYGRLPLIRLAMYINALHATCQDPRDFFALDLIDKLYADRHNAYHPRVKPFVYITLCLSNVPLERDDIETLYGMLTPQHNDEAAKDQRSLAITAMACVLQQYQEGYEKQQLRQKVHYSIQGLLREQKNDGSFGSVYSTAIAAQALMSTNLSSWNPKQTLDYLAGQIREDGSFGDMLSTYYTLPALSGRSLIHLRNTQCDPTATVSQTLSPQEIWKRPGPKKSVLYSIKIGEPETFSFSMQLSVPVDINFLDTMRIAAYLDPLFRFRSQSSNNQVHVYEIADVPNDPERGLYWNLYVLRDLNSEVRVDKRYTGGIETLIPNDSEEFLYWYRSTF